MLKMIVIQKKKAFCLKPTKQSPGCPLLYRVLYVLCRQIWPSGAQSNPGPAVLDEWGYEVWLVVSTKSVHFLLSPAHTCTESTTAGHWDMGFSVHRSPES